MRFKRHKDPFISVGGDFNQFDIQCALSDNPDIEQVLTSPTRGNKTIDLIFTNFNDNIIESGVIDPLERDLTGSLSDHSPFSKNAKSPPFLTEP